MRRRFEHLIVGTRAYRPLERLFIVGASSRRLTLLVVSGVKQLDKGWLYKGWLSASTPLGLPGAHTTFRFMRAG